MEQIRERFYSLYKSSRLSEGQVAAIIGEMSKRRITSEFQGFLSECKPFTILNPTMYDIYLEKEIIDAATTNLLKGIGTIKNYESEYISSSSSGERAKHESVTPKFQVFICYRRDTGEDFAEHLKIGLEKFGIRAFLDIKDIPEKFKGTEKWVDIRDNAIRESQTFLLIVTPGFCESSEVKKELNAGVSIDKYIVCFRHKDMHSNLRIDLKNKEIDLSKLQQIVFDTKQDLLRKAHRILVEEKNNSPPAETVNENTALNNSWGIVTNNEKQSDLFLTKNWNPLPVVKFNISQNLADVFQFPQVGWEAYNYSPYQLKIRINVRPKLGDKKLYPLADDDINGTKSYAAEPNSPVWKNGCFSLPTESVQSKADLILEIQSTVFDVNEPEKGEYNMLPSIWKYNRKDNTWDYYPQGF